MTAKQNVLLWKEKEKNTHTKTMQPNAQVIMLQIAQNSWKHLIKLQHYEHKYFRH